MSRQLEAMAERGLALPTLLISGNPGRAGQAPIAAGRPMLAKPFGLERLARSVLELVGSEGGERKPPEPDLAPGRGRTP